MGGEEGREERDMRRATDYREAGDIRRVDANGIEIAYLDRGEGSPVILLHGFPDIATTFEPLMDLLVKAGYRCVAPWLRGYPPTATGQYYDRGALVADAVALAEALGLGPVRIVGHDWGGEIAYSMSAALPDLVTSSVSLAIPQFRALATNTLVGYEQIKRSFYAWMFQIPDLAEMMVPQNDYVFIRNLWRDWSPGWEAPAAHLDDVVGTLQRPGTLVAAVSYYRAVLDDDRQDPAHESIRRKMHNPIRVPTLLLMGERDGCVAPDIAEGAEEAFAGPYEMAVVPDAGHFLHLEQPDEVARRVVEWFAAN